MKCPGLFIDVLRRDRRLGRLGVTITAQPAVGIGSAQEGFVARWIVDHLAFVVPDAADPAPFLPAAAILAQIPRGILDRFATSDAINCSTKSLWQVGHVGVGDARPSLGGAIVC